MALDRQSIEKRDFPIGRRGYEPAAVDAHLSAIAREVEALRRAQPSPSTTSAPARDRSLASIASAQVQAIVEAAESSAAAIERDARERAAQTEQDADRAAARTRSEAIEHSQTHVGQVSEAVGLMLQRVDAMQNELSALIDTLRTGGARLNADLSLLSGNMGELYDAAGRAAPVAAAPAPEPAVAADEPPAAEPKLVVDVEPVASDDEDIEGARLIALNMALNGQSRAETDKYLAENFDLSDRRALLDEVYTTVDG